MAKPIRSMESFLKGYRGETEPEPETRFESSVQAIEILDLFTEQEVQNMTLFEIASRLVVPLAEARKLVRELEKRDLVSVARGRRGNDRVSVTKRGQTLTQT